METFPDKTNAPQQNKINYVDLNPEYVTGLVEGICSFTYTRYNTNVVPRFALKMAKSDRDLIYSLMRYFNAGNVYYTGKNNLALVASSSSDLSRIIEHFDRYPLKGHKEDCYKLWRQMVDLKRDFRRSDFSKLTAIASALSEQQ